QTKRDLSFHLEGQQNGQRGASEGPARGQRRASEGPDIIQEYKGTMVQERGGERFATPAAPRTAHGPVYANGEAIHGPGFMLLYASIDNLADSMGIDRNTAHSLAKATAENWVANGIQVKDPQALFLQALRGIKGSKKPPRPEYTEAFEHWWALYPRKEGKGEAWDRFRKLTLTQQRAAYKALREQAEDLKARMSDKRGNFCPHPSTWLSQHRFDDPVRASAPSNPLLVRKPQEREFEWRARIGWEIKQGAIARDEAIAAGWRPEA
ncbi:MAG TPA: hypothetical protein VE986_08575, partial [Hyphomicrobiales bacterium]|nr:hypothetical protein [Hyphomicrobiales bacterium]